MYEPLPDIWADLFTAPFTVRSIQRQAVKNFMTLSFLHAGPDLTSCHLTLIAPNNFCSLVATFIIKTNLVDINSFFKATDTLIGPKRCIFVLIVCDEIKTI